MITMAGVALKEICHLPELKPVTNYAPCRRSIIGTFCVDRLATITYLSPFWPPGLWPQRFANGQAHVPLLGFKLV